jgi:hypothetical protein
MRRTPVVLGVLSMIFGGLYGLLCLTTLTMGSWVAALRAVDSSPAGVARSQLLAERVRFESFDNIGLFVWSLALVVIGWGLYRRSPWARRASIVWSALALAYVVVRVIAHFAVFLPHAEALLQAYPTELARHRVSETVAMGLLLVFNAPYPVVLLRLMARRSAQNDLLG